MKTRVMVSKIKNGADDEQQFSFTAHNAYDIKDSLKARGYNWDGEDKTWVLYVTGRDNAITEAQWLDSEKIANYMA